MGLGDTLQPAYPNNTHKQDWAFVGGTLGMGGGGLLVTTPVTRYSFWLDFDPFDVKNLKIFTQNVFFAIYADSGGNTPLIPWIIIDQSNDITDSLIEANLPTTPGGVIGVGNAAIVYPPFGYTDDGSGVAIGGTPPSSSAFGGTPSNLSASISVDGNLAEGQIYYYVVTAVNASSVESLPSNVASATPLLDNRTIALSWTSVSGASYYKVYRNTVNNFTSGSSFIGYYYAGQPPYYGETNVGTQPLSSYWHNDQGTHTMAGYQGYGWGFGSTTMVAQGFTPTQSVLTGLFLSVLFHTNSTNPSTFYPLNFELWNSSHQFVQHLGTLQPTYNANVEPEGLTTDSYCTAYCNSVSYNTGTDGNDYWVTINEPYLKFNTTINVVPNQLYYLVIRQATLSASVYYYIGMNLAASGLAETLYSYPYGNAYVATDGATSGWSQLVDSAGNGVTYPFITQGNLGRCAVTFWWANLGTVYWYGTPNSNDFVFLHTSFNQRI
jgi:hypothetical protein